MRTLYTFAVPGTDLQATGSLSLGAVTLPWVAGDTMAGLAQRVTSASGGNRCSVVGDSLFGVSDSQPSALYGTGAFSVTSPSLSGATTNGDHSRWLAALLGYVVGNAKGERRA